jgi:hypothetical protein
VDLVDPHSWGVEKGWFMVGISSVAGRETGGTPGGDYKAGARAGPGGAVVAVGVEGEASWSTSTRRWRRTTPR